MSALNNQSLKNTLENNLSDKMETGVVNHEAQLLGKAPLAHQNPLDRNGDGKIDSRDLSANQFNNGGMMMNQGLNNELLGQTTYVQSSQRASLGLVRSEPVLREVIQKDAVIREHIHPVQKEEIQPIIYREREQLDIKQVTQMMHETQIQPTILEQRELPAERRRDIIERGAPIVPNTVLPTSEVMSTTRTQQIHAPIVQETVRKTILEEIQPVLERDVYQSVVIQNTQPIYEKIIEAPRISREVREVGNVDMTRRLSQGYSTMPLTQGVSDVNTNFVQGQTFEQAVMQNRRLSQNYDQSVYNETLLTHHGLQNSGSQNLPLSQGQGYASGQGYVQGLGYAQPAQSNRLSQNMSDPLYQNRRLSQNMSQQPFGVNVGQAPAAGMNGTGIGLASAVPLNTAAPILNNGLARGFNEQSNIYNSGFAANNMVTSVGINGTHSVAGSVNSTVGNNLPRAPVMTPVSVMEQSLPSYRNYSDSSFGLQASPAYQNSLQGEKMRELEREQMLRQQNPQMYNAM